MYYSHGFYLKVGKGDGFCVTNAASRMFLVHRDLLYADDQLLGTAAPEIVACGKTVAVLRGRRLGVGIGVVAGYNIEDVRPLDC